VTLRVSFAGASDTGRVRPENEDHWSSDPDLGLFLVADGLGGHLAGELASRIVADSMPGLLRERLKCMPGDHQTLADTVVESIRELSSGLEEQTRHEPGLEGMGTTLVLLLVRDDRAIVAHLGDSRAYLLRDGDLKLLTRDHTIVQLLLDRDEISPAEALAHPSRGQVTRYVGMPGHPLPETRSLELRAGDRLLLCSDGLTNMVSEDRIGQLLADEPDRETCCDLLLAAANASGGSDNITAVVVDLSDSTST